MNREVFRASLLTVLLFPIFFTAAVLFIYFANGNISPLILFVFLIIPILTLAKFKEKLLVEHDILRYQGIFSGKEVSLKKVSQITVRNVETTDSDNKTSIKRVAYVLDESGQTFFSFPAKLISTKDQTRFIEVVTTVNPDIKIGS